MAALNTLRTKGGVVLAVVIGASLLAFLLGDFTSSGGSLLNNSNMSVGTVDGKKVSLQDFSKEVEDITLVEQMLTGVQSPSAEQMDGIRNQTWDATIRRIAFEPSFNNLGIIVSEGEQVDMAGGEYISPILRNIFTNPETGMFDRNAIKNFTSSIQYDQTGRNAAFWAEMEKEIISERAFTKYFTLVEKAAVVTSLEVDMLADFANTNSNVSFVTKPSYSVADSLVTVSESEMKEYYNNNKEKFRTSERRDVEYVTFDGLPSAKDYENAAKDITALAVEFEDAEDAGQFVNVSGFNRFDETFRPASYFPAALAAYVADENRAAIYGPIKEGDKYTVARLVESKMLPDTVGAKHILLAATDTALADSLVAVLKKDKSKFAELATQFSQDQNANMSGGDLGRFATNMMVPEFSAAVFDSKKGEIITVNTQFGLHVVEVTEVGPKAPKYQVALIDYTINPSSETLAQSFAKASAFASKVAGGSDFDKEVAEEGVSKRVTRLAAGDRTVQGVEGSTEIVRWAFDNEAGAVSEVISIEDANYVAKVTSTIEHGYSPFASVKDQVRSAVLTEKKCQYLAETMNGSSLEAIASSVDEKVLTASDVNFKLYYVPDMGVAPKVVGAVSAMEQGTTSAPIISNGSVIVVKIDQKVAAENTTAKDERAIVEANEASTLSRRALAAVYSLADIQDMRIKFF